MNRQSFYAGLFLLTITIGCKKEGQKEDNIDTQMLENPTSYLLKRQTFEHTSGTNGMSILFDYNSNNQVSKMSHIEWVYSNINVPPVLKTYDTTIYSFEYQNDLPVKCNVKGISGNLSIEYLYKGKQMDRQVTRWPNGDIQGFVLFKYNDDGKLSEATDSIPGRVNFRHVYEYNDNVYSVTTYVVWSVPQRKSKSVFANYDSRVNYIRAVNGLPMLSRANSFNLHPVFSFSPNNYGLEDFYWPVDVNSNFGTPSTSVYTYEYNDEGLPIKMYYGSWTVSFDYVKYK